MTITEAISEFTYATQTSTAGTSYPISESCTVNG